jgi:hypothetical protein
MLGPAINLKLKRSSQLQEPMFSTNHRLSRISPWLTGVPSGIVMSSRKARPGEQAGDGEAWGEGVPGSDSRLGGEVWLEMFEALSLVGGL